MTGDMVLIEFNRNWGDEFDVHGLAIMARDQYAKLLVLAVDTNWYFGTNEAFEHEDTSKSFRIVTEHPHFIDVLKTVLNFGNYDGYLSWGNFPCFEELYEDNEI